MVAEPEMWLPGSFPKGHEDTAGLAGVSSESGWKNKPLSPAGSTGTVQGLGGLGAAGGSEDFEPTSENLKMTGGGRVCEDLESGGPRPTRGM